MLSKESTPANEEFIAGVEEINKKAAKNECDPISGKEYTKEELKHGNWAKDMFKKAENLKEKPTQKDSNPVELESK